MRSSRQFTITSRVASAEGCPMQPSEGHIRRKGSLQLKSCTRPPVACKMASLGRLMLIVGACALQAFLTAAFNAGKDIQQALDVRVKAPYPSSSGLLIHSRFKQPHRHSPLSSRACGRTLPCAASPRYLPWELVPGAVLESYVPPLWCSTDWAGRKRGLSRRVPCCRRQRSSMPAIKLQNAATSDERVSSCWTASRCSCSIASHSLL